MAPMPSVTCQPVAAKFAFAAQAPTSCKASPARSRLGPVGIRRFVILVAALILFTGVNGTEETAGSEYESKADLMLTFAEFIEWPAYAFPDAAAPIVLGVIGEDPFGDVLEKLKDHPVNSRKIEIRRFRGNSEFRGQETPGRRQDDLTSKRNRKVQQLKGCHILFISPSERNSLPQLLKPLKGGNILTVGDTSEFIRQGGIIGFVRMGKRFQFEINLSAAQEAQLKISSKLLDLARVVEGAPPPDRN
jgi:hypothetical protein